MCYPDEIDVLSGSLRYQMPPVCIFFLEISEECGIPLAHSETNFRMRQPKGMANVPDPKKDRIADYIDENLKKVFSELEGDDMPDEILDLLAVLRAQDEALKSKE